MCQKNSKKYQLGPVKLSLKNRYLLIALSSYHLPPSWPNLAITLIKLTIVFQGSARGTLLAANLPWPCVWRE